MVTAFARGFGYLLQGAAMLPRKGVRIHLIIPLMINIVLFLLGSWLLFTELSDFIDGYTSYLPDWEWIAGLVYLVKMMIFTAAIAVVFMGVSMIALLVAAPFNAVLAKSVEKHLLGEFVNESEISRSIMAQLPHLVMEEIRKIIYFIIRAIPLLILFVIPVINIAAPALWFAFSGWMLAITYTAYPLENHEIPFKNQHAIVKQKRWTTFGFGIAVLLVTMIPFVNLVVMPVAVSGAAVFYTKELRD
ncbi:MAG: sulfate transporter CysZ [Gammaproteobacteria bacterium]|nr:sulfate transporter CysZ [Gammaproteobacteria bacterium]